MSAMYCKYQR